jgi:hypothetical protein
MVNKNNNKLVIGELIRYKDKLNPLSTVTYVLVRVNNEIIQVPVDYRQTMLIEKEYPIGSDVEMRFDGNWHIQSKPVPCDFDINYIVKNTF